MSNILVTNETYNSLNSLYANAGDWVDCTFEFSTKFYIGSGISAPFTYTNTGTQFFISSPTIDFGADGFIAGDTIRIEYTHYLGGGFQSYVRVIDFVNGGNLFLTVALPTSLNSLVFPTNGVMSGMSISALKSPDAVEVEINLAPNGTTTTNSVIDGSTTRLEYPTSSAMAVSDVVDMAQLGYKSGGLVKDVQLTYVADNSASGYRDWKITYKMLQWGVIKDGFSEPNYYDNTECLAPAVKIRAFSQYGNPNGLLSGESENDEANTGGFDENYNGGVNNYAFNSIIWTDLLGNVIDAVDYSASSNFTATITQAVQSTTLSKYNIGLLFRPVDGSVYQNLTTNLGENLLLNAPDVDFLHSTTPNTTVYAGYQNSVGAAWGLTNLQFTQSGGTLTISGQVQPNAACSTYFANFPDGERLTTLWVGLSNHLTTAQYSDRVNVKIFNADNIDAPIKGVQIPDVVNEFLFDHANINITTNPSPQTTTEDDVLYKSDFRLVDNVDYEGIRTRIFAYNTVTQEEFTLENNFFSFANVVNINGQFQPNITINRGFNLPPATDRNVLKLIRDTSLDVAGKYGVQLTYGFLNDWRYWLAQAGVDNDFFNITQSNNGQNKDWQHYSNSGNWIIRLSYYTSVNGVEDFNNYAVGINPYEADLNVTTANTFLIDSLGQNATSLLDDHIHTMTSVCTWNANYLNAWAEVTIEDYESGNRWVISSVLPQGNITNNPLKPILGGTKLDLQILGNTATLKCKIDTNFIDVSKVCVTSRIYSEDNTTGFVINTSGDAEVAYSLRRLTTTTIYPANQCIKVRRDSDNTEQDIGFVGDVLDTASLLAFVGTDEGDNGYVSVWYDQSGNGNNATMSTLVSQPLIVGGGIVTLSSNGKPAVKFDGTNDYLSLSSGVQVAQVFYESFVFDRLATGIVSLSLGTDVALNPYSTLWETTNSLFSGMEDSGNNLIATSAQTGSLLLSNWRVASSNAVSMRINGGGIGFNSYEVGVPGRLVTFGLTKGAAASVFHNGFISELIHYKTDQVINQPFIETNTNNFYTIY